MPKTPRRVSKKAPPPGMSLEQDVPLIPERPVASDVRLNDVSVATFAENGIPLLAAQVEVWDLDDLYPDSRNTRLHDETQKVALEQAMRRYGWTMPLLIREDGGIIAGHARWEVATDRLRLRQGPCIVARGWSDDMIRAYVIWDNRSAEMGKWDLPLLKAEVTELAERGFELSLTGFDLPTIDGLILEAGLGPKDDGGSTYSRKIAAPIYEPKSEKAPPVRELIDTERTDKLLARIADEDLPADVRAFLNHAAQRHTVFDFHAIAEFYAHAPAATQRLMEDSALVIIDFDKAIERGFVSLNDRLRGMASAMEAGETPEPGAAAGEADA